MKSPQWTKPALGGMIVGAGVAVALGFGVAGWMTKTSADTMARTETQAALVSVLVPICLNQAKADPELAPKMARLQAASIWSKDDVVSDTGWATMPGAERPARGVAAACADGLIKAVSTD